MRESLLSISLRLGRAWLRVCDLIGIKARKWNNGADVIDGIPTPVAASDLPPSYDPTSFPGAGSEGPEEYGNLPEAYGETRLVLLPVHPYLIHAYWEVTPDDLEGVKRRLGEDLATARAVLRFYDITYIEFDGNNAHSFFDVEIDLRVNNWKVHLWSPEKSYIAELGFKRTDGEYSAVTRSNVAHTPRAWPSVRVEASYIGVGEEGCDVGIIPDDLASGERANWGQTRDGGPQADGGVQSVNSERKLGVLEPAAGEEKGLGPGEIPRSIDAFEMQSEKIDQLYEPRPSAPLFGRPDFTELCEQKFISGLSSVGKGRDGG